MHVFSFLSRTLIILSARIGCCLGKQNRKFTTIDFGAIKNKNKETGRRGACFLLLICALKTRDHSHSIINKTEIALFLLCFSIPRFVDTIVCTILGKCCNLPVIANAAIINQATGVHFTGHAPRKPGINTRSPSTPSTV